MKRSPLAPGRPPKRRTPLRSASHLERSELRREARINPVNRERRARLYERNFGAYSDVIRALPCCTCGRRAPSDPSHVRARGMGGCNGSKRDLVPQCRECHRAFEADRAGFQAARGIDLAAVAAELWARHGEEVGA